VAVEHLGLLAAGEEAPTDYALIFLTPTGMVFIGVHVRIEAILVGRGLVPCGCRLVVDKTHLDNRFDALDAIFPRDHDAHGRTILVGQRLTIKTEAKQSQRMHCLIHAQTFGIWPVEHGGPLPRHRSPVLDWPYTEGLRMDEAMHPLALLCFGLYGETLPNQDGAPVRIVVPWKYGFKSIKSIVKIKFVEHEPPTT